MSPTPGFPVMPDPEQVHLRGEQAILIWTAGAFCIYGWDWIICLPQEYQNIWKKKITPITFLYLANRYFGFFLFSVSLSLMTNAWGPEACKYMFYWNPVGYMITMSFSQMILAVRVYALYGQSRMVGIMLAFVFIVEVCLGGITISFTSAPAPGPPGVTIPCVTVPAPLGWMITSFSMQLFFDTFTFLLTAWKIYSIWRKEINIPLVAVVWRDGIFYFFAIFTMNFINILIFLIAPNSLIWVVNLTPTLIFTIILSCRLVLNIRNVPRTSVNSSGQTLNKTKNPA